MTAGKPGNHIATRIRVLTGILLLVTGLLTAQAVIATEPTHTTSHGDENRTATHGIISILSHEFDSDRVPVSKELQHGTSPFVADTDLDGLPDRLEIRSSTNATVADTDNDGLHDGAEQRFGTDPLNNDTDDDGVNDSAEVYRYNSNPTDPTTVNNGLTDGEQTRYGLHPAANPAVDELNQSLADIHRTNPVPNPVFIGEDSDGDGFTDHFEQETPAVSPSQKDVIVRVAWTQGNAPPVARLLQVQEAYSNAPIDNGTGIQLHFYIDGRVDAPENLTMTNFYNDVYPALSTGRSGQHYALYTDRVLYKDESYGGFSLYDVPAIAIADQNPRLIGHITMHELGHSLGLTAPTYDGIDSHEKTVEEYPSAMNYNAQGDCQLFRDYCYTYSTGTGNNDWTQIEQLIEAGAVTPDGNYDAAQCTAETEIFCK